MTIGGRRVEEGAKGGKEERLKTGEEERANGGKEEERNVGGDEGIGYSVLGALAPRNSNQEF